MSFKLNNLTPYANNAKKGVIPALWLYYNEDADTLTTAGFFDKDCGVANNDRILVLSTTAIAPDWYKASVSNGVITLAKAS